MTHAESQLIATRLKARVPAEPTTSNAIGAEIADSHARPLLALCRHAVGTGFDGHSGFVRALLQCQVRAQVFGAGVL